MILYGITRVKTSIYKSMHQCGSSLSINTECTKNKVQNDYENNMFTFPRGTGLLEPMFCVFFSLNSHLIFKMNCALGHQPWSPSSSSASPGEKWPAAWLPVLFLKGDVIYTHTRRCRVQGLSARQTHLSDRNRGGREEVEKDGVSKCMQ